MDIVRLQNIWNIQYLAARFKEMGNDIVIEHQQAGNPILPVDFDSLTKEYVDIYIAEQGGVRAALFVAVANAQQRVQLREFTVNVYPDVRYEKI